jgi:hypothetical protein
MNRRSEDEKEGMSEQEHFLGRWSRRKQAVKKSELEADSVTAYESADGSGKSNDHENSLSATPSLTDEDMPSLEDLDGDSDYASFLSSDVSEELRRMALRQLFHSAQFNICDGLDDYDEDFTSFEKLGDIVTADMKHRMNTEEQEEEVESALLESQVEEDADPAADAPVGEYAASEPVEKRVAAVDEETTRLGESDNEVDTQPDSAPDSIGRSQS